MGDKSFFSLCRDLPSVCQSAGADINLVSRGQDMTACISCVLGALFDDVERSSRTGWRSFSGSAQATYRQRSKEGFIVPGYDDCFSGSFCSWSLIMCLSQILLVITYTAGRAEVKKHSLYNIFLYQYSLLYGDLVTVSNNRSPSHNTQERNLSTFGYHWWPMSLSYHTFSLLSQSICRLSLEFPLLSCKRPSTSCPVLSSIQRSVASITFDIPVSFKMIHIIFSHSWDLFPEAKWSILWILQRNTPT